MLDFITVLQFLFDFNNILRPHLFYLELNKSFRFSISLIHEFDRYRKFTIIATGGRGAKRNFSQGVNVELSPSKSKFTS